VGEVFISYARESADTAKVLAEQLQTRGFDVWWDDNLRSGQRFDDVIRQQLEAAEAVIVIWSPASVQSQYVKMEAGIAYAWETLITVRTADLPLEAIPTPFRPTESYRPIISQIPLIESAIEQSQTIISTALRGSSLMPQSGAMATHGTGASKFLARRPRLSTFSIKGTHGFR
jgi:hypothetical protein